MVDTVGNRVSRWTVSQKCIGTGGALLVLRRSTQSRSNFLGYVHGFGRIANGRHRREQGVEMDGTLETQERFLGCAGTDGTSKMLEAVFKVSPNTIVTKKYLNTSPAVFDTTNTSLRISTTPPQFW